MLYSLAVSVPLLRVRLCTLVRVRWGLWGCGVLLVVAWVQGWVKWCGLSLVVVAACLVAVVVVVAVVAVVVLWRLWLLLLLLQLLLMLLCVVAAGVCVLKWVVVGRMRWRKGVIGRGCRCECE